MKNYKKIALILLIIGIVFATAFFIRSNNKALVPFETTKMIKATIENKIVATGKVVPEDEVEIKPQIAGIIDKILVKEGDKVIIIGGTHRGREGMLVGSTPKMYYVRVGRAQEVRVQKGNVTSYALLEKLVKALVLK